MKTSFNLLPLVLASSLASLGVACGSDSPGGTQGAGGGNSAGSPNTTGDSGASSSAGSATNAGGSDSAHAGKGSAGGTKAGGSGSGGSNSAGSNSAGTSDGGSASAMGGRPAGWLYTDGAQLKVSDGKGSGTDWIGRGVNMDDIMFCGYNGNQWMTDPGGDLQKVAEGLISGWKPNFIRLSLSLASFDTVSWLDSAGKYTKAMTDVVKAIGKHDGVYVLLVLRSDASMIGQDMMHGDPEATGIPSDATTTPDKTKFPTGTDAVYTALVDTFKDDKFVAFGLTNEPGGNLLSNDQIQKALDHATATIRKEEDKLGVPHHIVSVQGQGWTSDISFYAKTPLTYDNVVYEVHGYPPKKESYTYANIPVIIGEYGSLDGTAASAFFADMEAKKLSNLAWDFEPFSDCAPDLLTVNHSSTDLVASDWGKVVQAYLLAHAK